MLKKYPLLILVIYLLVMVRCTPTQSEEPMVTRDVSTPQIEEELTNTAPFFITLKDVGWNDGYYPPTSPPQDFQLVRSIPAQKIDVVYFSPFPESNGKHNSTENTHLGSQVVLVYNDVEQAQLAIDQYRKRLQSSGGGGEFNHEFDPIVEDSITRCITVNDLSGIISISCQATIQSGVYIVDTHLSVDNVNTTMDDWQKFLTATEQRLVENIQKAGA